MPLCTTHCRIGSQVLPSRPYFAEVTKFRRVNIINWHFIIRKSSLLLPCQMLWVLWQLYYCSFCKLHRDLSIKHLAYLTFRSSLSIPLICLLKCFNTINMRREGEDTMMIMRDETVSLPQVWKKLMCDYFEWVSCLVLLLWFYSLFVHN